MDVLDLDEFFVQLLVVEGFINLEEVVYVDLDELLFIDGVDEGMVLELQICVCEYLEVVNKVVLENVCVLGVEDSLIEFEGLMLQMVEVLVKDDVKMLEDFVMLVDWEIVGGWIMENG